MGCGATARCPHPGRALGAEPWPGAVYLAGLGAMTQVFLQVALRVSRDLLLGSPEAHTHPGGQMPCAQGRGRATPQADVWGVSAHLDQAPWIPQRPRPERRVRPGPWLRPLLFPLATRAARSWCPSESPTPATV